MDRRESIKMMLLGALGSGYFFTACEPDSTPGRHSLTDLYDFESYGRTKAEKERDLQLFKEQFFTDHELATVAVLCDLTLPATDTAGSAGEAGVPEFIDFIVKDMPYLQDHFREGITWLDGYANQKFGSRFTELTEEQQKSILDEIAYPDTAADELEEGVRFFREVRNFTLTGYYTTEMGFNDLGYVGNRPNIWDGVPQEVLDDHGLEYTDEWLSKCVDQDKRMDIAEWDEDGNLLT